jgi:hypothetical protein
MYNQRKVVNILVNRKTALSVILILIPVPQVFGWLVADWPIEIITSDMTQNRI